MLSWYVQAASELYGRGSHVFKLDQDGNRSDYMGAKGGRNPFRFALSFRHYDPGALHRLVAFVVPVLPDSWCSV